MNINVKIKLSEQPISVVVNEECNHADISVIEVEHVDYHDPIDLVWYTHESTCNNCGAMWDEVMEWWD